MRILIGENPAKAMNEFWCFSEVRFVFNIGMSRQHIAVKVINSAILIDNPRTKRRASKRNHRCGLVFGSAAVYKADNDRQKFVSGEVMIGCGGRI